MEDPKKTVDFETYNYSNWPGVFTDRVNIYQMLAMFVNTSSMVLKNPLLAWIGLALAITFYASTGGLAVSGNPINAFVLPFVSLLFIYVDISGKGAISAK